MELHPQTERTLPVVEGAAPSPEERLSHLTDHCAEILKRWAVTAERHARAINQLESHLDQWNDAGVRLQQDAAQRIQDLERVVQHEWDALRRLHEQPVKQLSEQAASLTEVCIATANSAQTGFDRAEARLAVIEMDFHRRMSELTDEVRAVAAELRVRPGTELQPASAEPAPWSFDGVTRLHHQLRQANGSSARPADIAARATPPARPVRELPESAASLADRVDSIERTLTDRETDLREAASRKTVITRASRVAIAAIVVALAASVLAWRLRSDVRAATARVERAELASERATQTAGRQVAAARSEASREIEAARTLATRAQMIGDVLAAPDLIRYGMTGRGLLATASAQLLWSRSRGLVFSGSRVPAAPPGSTYQLWLLTRGAAVTAGTFAPESTGAATLAGATPDVSRAVVGAMVTLEPNGGSQTPTGDALLARFPAAVD